MNITNQSYTKADEVVKLRNGMEMILREGVKKGNLGDTDFLKRALNRIQTSYDGYTINMRLREDIAIDRKLYRAGERATVIMENGKPLFIIYSDKNDELTKLYVDPFDLMYEKDRKDTFKAETRAMEMQGEWKFEYQEILKEKRRMNRNLVARA